MAVVSDGDRWFSLRTRRHWVSGRRICAWISVLIFFETACAAMKKRIERDAKMKKKNAISTGTAHPWTRGGRRKEPYLRQPRVLRANILQFLAVPKIKTGDSLESPVPFPPFGLSTVRRMLVHATHAAAAGGAMPTAARSWCFLLLNDQRFRREQQARD